jgi:hypothetical protein
VYKNNSFASGVLIAFGIHAKIPATNDIAPCASIAANAGSARTAAIAVASATNPTRVADPPVRPTTALASSPLARDSSSTSPSRRFLTTATTIASRLRVVTATRARPPVAIVIVIFFFIVVAIASLLLALARVDVARDVAGVIIVVVIIAPVLSATPRSLARHALPSARFSKRKAHASNDVSVVSIFSFNLRVRFQFSVSTRMDDDDGYGCDDDGWATRGRVVGAR